MDNPSDRLLTRLDDIAASLARREGTVALIGVGSVGAELDRIDEYSDLDFFVIVEPPYQAAFIADLSWLKDAAPIAFSFQNTRHGHKVLFADGIYAEFAVFHPDELATMTFAGARIIWQREGTQLPDLSNRVPGPAQSPSEEWLLGEILTNLYVGLSRLRLGEQLAAQRLIQGHAVDRLMELCSFIEPASSAHEDLFDRSRRFEQRFPQTAQFMPYFAQGYDRSAESALDILEFLKRHFAVNPAIEQRIRDLAE